MRKFIVAWFVLLASILAMLSIFNPKTVALPLLMAVFILIYAFFVVSVLLVIKWAHLNLSNMQSLFVACVIAFCPVTLLALQSIGSLSFLDAILSIVIPVIFVWYGLKRSKIG